MFLVWRLHLLFAVLYVSFIPAFSIDFGNYINDALLKFTNQLTSHKLVRRDVSSGRKGYARLEFSNCGDNSDPVQVDQFKVVPNPVSVPGNVEVGLRMDVRENQTAPLPVSLEMMKKIPLLFGLATWLRVPCLANGIGSCLYDDLCATQLFSENQCVDPNTEKEIACGCPFRKGFYVLKPASFQIPEPPNDVPGYLLEGEFFVKAVVSRKQQQIACYSTNVDLSL